MARQAATFAVQSGPNRQVEGAPANGSSSKKHPKQNASKDKNQGNCRCLDFLPQSLSKKINQKILLTFSYPPKGPRNGPRPPFASWSPSSGSFAPRAAGADPWGEDYLVFFPSHAFFVEVVSFCFNFLVSFFN